MRHEEKNISRLHGENGISRVESKTISRGKLKTIKSYKSCIRSFLQYIHPRHPKDITSDEIRSYLLHLIDDKRFSSGTVNQVFNALRFLYVDACVFGRIASRRSSKITG
ncbi:MAG: site-specific integrase [Bacteroidota bacterium]|nr:site-specific integrase [Bacteroidota bacterium]